MFLFYVSGYVRLLIGNKWNGGISLGKNLKYNQRLFTYPDYLTWPDDERWELINGKAYNMTPAPSRKHQEISGQLHTLFNNYMK